MTFTTTAFQVAALDPPCLRSFCACPAAGRRDQQQLSSRKPRDCLQSSLFVLFIFTVAGTNNSSGAASAYASLTSHQGHSPSSLRQCHTACAPVNGSGNQSPRCVPCLDRPAPLAVFAMVPRSDINNHLRRAPPSPHRSTFDSHTPLCIKSGMASVYCCIQP
jgi:hypothetical protein